MKIVLIGGTGRTGSHVLTEALRRGHEVTALARTPGKLADAEGAARVMEGDSTDVATLDRLLPGADVVISALGPTAKEADLHSRTAQALVEAMPRHGVPRFVGVSGAGIDVPGDRKGPRDKLVSWLIQRLGGAVVQDKPREYAIFADSSIDWTLVRPPRLTDKPGTGRVEHDAHRPGRSTSISRADLAGFLLDVAEGDVHVRQAPFASGIR